MMASFEMPPFELSMAKWSVDNVCAWLVSIGIEEATPEVNAKKV